MTGPVKDPKVAAAIFQARVDHPELVPFASGVNAGDDRSSYLNASEAGTCARRLWYDRNEAPPAGGNERPGVFDRGHAAEAWAVNMIGAAGMGKLLFAGDQQKRLIDAKHRIAGTPDGLLVAARETVVEIKSYGPTVDRSVSPAPANVAQTELVIELFNRTTKHKPADGLLVYLSTADYTMLHVYRVPRRAAIWLEMVGKAKNILNATSARDVVPSPSMLCAFCPFRIACAAADPRAVPLEEKIGEEGVDQLDAAVQDFLEKRDAKARADAEAIAAEMALKKKANDLGLDKANRPSYTFRILKEPGESRLDEVAVADMIGNLEPFRRRLAPTEKIEVKAK